MIYVAIGLVGLAIKYRYWLPLIPVVFYVAAMWGAVPALVVLIGWPVTVHQIKRYLGV